MRKQNKKREKETKTDIIPRPTKRAKIKFEATEM
jgi:hypothetical protein